MSAPLFPLIKADAAQRVVKARIDETPDRAGEVFDYASSKPLIKSWSDGQAQASRGQSLGNVRAMHALTAAGKVVDIKYDDMAKAVEFTIHVVDDDAWAKVESGVFTGVSPGGRYAKRWPDGPHTRYTAAPNELSLVDVPCIPTATFSLVKADGTTQEVPFLLSKAGARHSKADADHLQAIHDHAVGMGATCPGHEDGDGDGDLGKAMGSITGQVEALTKALAAARAANEALEKRLSSLEAQPKATAPALLAVPKEADALGKANLAAAKPEDLTLEKIAAMPVGAARGDALVAYAKAQRAT